VVAVLKVDVVELVIHPQQLLLKEMMEGTLLQTLVVAVVVMLL
tara:strand:+ start:146 stop:274 length:129 start_codon:yes stop_codon:yes gene_type:complete